MEIGLNYLTNIASLRSAKLRQQAGLRGHYRPEDVVKMKAVADDYLVPPGKSPIEFIGFRLREMDAGRVIFEIRKPEGEDVCTTQRLTRYDLTPEFLKIGTLSATVEFRVGPEPIQELRMIERHFYKNTLLISHDFNFGFCIPDSVNTWDHTYEFPNLPPATLRGMIAEPYQTKSDSFYFANSKLILHEKAEYSFTNAEINRD